MKRLNRFHSNTFGHSLKRGIKPCLALAASLLLASCAMVDSAKPGTPLTQVIERFGKPSTDCANADGTRHVVWTQQPLGQTALGATVGKDGTIGPVTQLLTDASFNRLGTGEWTPEKVICEFGPPEHVGESGMYELRRYTLDYRYKQYGTWNSMMYVFFDLNTHKLVSFNPGPDPLFDLSRSGRH
jgi:hypothetical protein